MSYIDIIITIPLLWFGYKGFRNGLIRELVSIIAIIAGIYASLKFSFIVSSWIENEKIPETVFFAITFIIVLIIVFLLGKMVEKIIKLIIPEFINSLAGAIFGAGKILLICSAIIFFINSIDSKEIILTPKSKSSSLIYPYAEPIVPKLKIYFDNI